MPICSFCKRNYEEHKGLVVFTFDGRSIYFCSSKCRRNADLKRDPKKTNWVKRQKKTKAEKDKLFEKNLDQKEKKEEKEEKKEKDGDKKDTKEVKKEDKEK